MGLGYFRPMPRPGARAARRAARVSSYEPRYQLCAGHDPWQAPAQAKLRDWEPLDPEEIRSLGLVGFHLVPELT